MFLLTEKNAKQEGAYAVKDKMGDKVLFIFTDGDDAERYCQQVQEDHGVSMRAIEIDEALAIKACEMYNYKYTVITPNDIVVPPPLEDDQI
tara:strand:+ start:1428 stop:1700 length:273 start_codon:yes stop_codon:yes gene_type:complete